MDFRTTIISQYLAALEMLKQTILACPEALWFHPDDHNKFAQVAYHALFYTHLYLQESEQAFQLWSEHREEYRLGGGDSAASGEPATKAIVLAYLAFCQREVVEKGSTLVFEADSGFDWLQFSKFELQLYSIRHIQQHVGELMERLGTQASEIDWVGSQHVERKLPSMATQPENALIDLIRYNNWANAQLLAVCQQLTADQLAAAAPGAYGAIRDTLAHIIRAEADYVGRLTGVRPQPSFKWQEQVALADLAAFADQVAGALLAAIQRIPPTHIVHEEEDGNTIDYQARVLFIQVINHGIEHRTNITTILSGLGLPAPEVDGWGYLWAHPDQFELKESSQ